MHQIFPSSLFFICLLLIPLSLCADDSRFSACKTSFVCGNLGEFSYPFWGNDLPDYCGYPGFHLDCRADFPTTIEIETGRQYRVLNIDEGSKTLRIARTDFINTICPDLTKLYNSTLNFTLFEYASGYQNISFVYGCPTGVLFSNPFSCNTSGSAYYFLSGGIPTDGLSSCGGNIFVPVLENDLLSIVNSSSPGPVIEKGFEVKWVVDTDSCTECVNSGGKCGYDTSTNEATCYCRDKPYASKCGKEGRKSSTVDSIPLIAGFSIVTIVIILCCLRKKIYKFFSNRRSKNSKNLEDFLKNCTSLATKRYNYSDIKKMTNSFKDKLGQGGFGGVYKGKLHDNGCLVAVKVLSESKGNGEDFVNEVASISRTSHVNIVSLLGFCLDGPNRALIYEFMPNGSLEKFIYSEKQLGGHLGLGWKRLHQIAVDIARGLEYLHRGCNTRILHFDIKPHNILLDEDFCPKIADFGLAKLCLKKESIISMAPRGTVGYIAPEVFYPRFGRVSHKSDVYSYGMMILEMVGGRKNINEDVDHTSEVYFPHWIHKRLELDENLGLHATTEEDEELARKMILVGLWCIQTNPTNRPSISKVLEMLERSVESLQIPPKTFPSSPPPRSPADSSTTSMA